MLISLWNGAGFNQNRNLPKVLDEFTTSPKPIWRLPILLSLSPPPISWCSGPQSHPAWAAPQCSARTKEDKNPVSLLSQVNTESLRCVLKLRGTFLHTDVPFFFPREERRSIRKLNNVLTVLSETAWLHLVLLGHCQMAVSFKFWMFGRYFIFVKLHF